MGTRTSVGKGSGVFWEWNQTGRRGEAGVDGAPARIVRVRKLKSEKNRILTILAAAPRGGRNKCVNHNPYQAQFKSKGTNDRRKKKRQ